MILIRIALDMSHWPGDGNFVNIRYKGFSELLDSFRRIGLMSVRHEHRVTLNDWSELCFKVLAATSDGTIAGSSVLPFASLKSALSGALPSLPRTESAIEALEA
jgi:hypothetical protein